MILALVPLLCASPALPVQESLPEELARVREDRVVDPEDPELLARYAALLGRSGDEDGEVAYSLYAIEAFEVAETDDEQTKERTIEQLEKRVKKLDPSVHRLRGKRDHYLEELE